MKKLPFNTLMNALWFVLLTHGVACKPKDEQQFAALSVTKSISWEQLKVGQRFRMSPPNETSGNCGDQEYWVVTKAHNPYIKQIKSFINHKCLEFADGNLKAAICNTDGSQPSKNARGDGDLSPLQRQYLSLADGSLAPAFRRDCSGVTRAGGHCKVLADSTKAAGRSAPVVFTVGGGSPSPGDKLIFRSDVKQAKDEAHTGSFASEIRWGNFPRVKAIFVATQGQPFANTSNSWITGIQIHYASGEKFLIGNCQLGRDGNCVVDNDDHPKYPNPILFDKDEYLTAVSMKFGVGSMRMDRRNLPHGNDTRLTEMVKAHMFMLVTFERRSLTPTKPQALKRPTIWLEHRAKFRPIASSPGLLICGIPFDPPHWDRKRV
jgi:hypothetical protein